MRSLSIAFALSAIVLLSGCGPALNWRDVAIGGTTLVTLFPCKPDDTERAVLMAGVQQAMTMHSCHADGATFALGHARLTDPTQAARVLMQWREATLSGLGPVPSAVDWQPLPGTPSLPGMLALRASRDPSREPTQTLQGLWFARGPDVFAALVLAPTLRAEAAETFFSGLRLR